MAAEACLVIGLGNAARADDGVGPLVASLLAGLAGVRSLCRDADALALLDDWAGSDLVFIVDAAAGAGPPGSIHRVQLSGPHAPGSTHPASAGHARVAAVAAATPSSTHGLGLPQALALAHTLDRLPRRLILYAIEGASFDCGAPLSAVVRAAAQRTADRIRRELRAVGLR